MSMRDTTTIAHAKSIENELEDKGSALSRVAERIKLLTEVAHDIFVRQEALANRIFGEDDGKKAMDDDLNKAKVAQEGTISVIFHNLETLQEMLRKIAANSQRLEAA